MPQKAGRLFYQLYFQTPGVAETEFERDVRLTLRTLLYAISGDARRFADSVVDRDAAGMVSRDGGLLTLMPNPEALPPWLSEADVDIYAAEFARTGFRGGLTWYRNIDRNWELLAPFAGAKVLVPAVYIAGDCDVVLDFPGVRQRIRDMAKFVPRPTPNDHFTGLRALDPTGAGCGGQYRHDRFSQVVVGEGDGLVIGRVIPPIQPRPSETRASRAKPNAPLPLGVEPGLDGEPREVRFRRISPVATRSGESPFTIRFADLRHRSMQTV
jgi:hypothetical protein